LKAPACVVFVIIRENSAAPALVVNARHSPKQKSFVRVPLERKHIGIGSVSCDGRNAVSNYFGPQVAVN
jgi:hypothetical protein